MTEAAVERERDALVSELEKTKQEKSWMELAEARLVNELQEAASTKDVAIQDLKAKL